MRWNKLKHFLPWFIVFLLTATLGYTAYTTLVHFDRGGDYLVVESSGFIDINSGGTVDLNSGAELTISGEAEVQSAGELEVLSGGILDIQSGATFNLLGYNVVVGEYWDDPNADTTSFAVSGLDYDDLIFASLAKETTAGVYLVAGAYTILGNGNLAFYFSADPAESVKVPYMVLMD